MARKSWTDERLDALNLRAHSLAHRVDRGFDETRGEFKAVRAEMRGEFAAVRAEMREEFGAVRTEMREEFGAVRTEMRHEFGSLRDQMNADRRTTLQLAGAMWATTMVGFLGVVATVLAAS